MLGQVALHCILHQVVALCVDTFRCVRRMLQHPCTALRQAAEKLHKLIVLLVMLYAGALGAHWNRLCEL